MRDGIRSVAGFTLLLLGVALASSAIARDLSSSSPQRQGLSADRLERINQHMIQAVEDGTMVGGQGMISRNGRIVFSESWGLSDRESGKPMADDAIFRIYSMTKPVTGVALMMLYEEGRFFLNDPVAKYLPELANLQVALSTTSTGTGNVTDGSTSFDAGQMDDALVGQTRPAARQPTIRDLLRHTAGFTYGIFGDTEVDKLYRGAQLLVQPTIRDFVVELGKLPLQYDPGSRWHYSVSVDVQGRLVEVLSGMSFGDFLRQRIFEPLGMTDTSFYLPADKSDRLATLYAPEGASAGANAVWQRNTSTRLVRADPEATRAYEERVSFESGGGGLLSTSQDYMRFCLMMLNGGELNGERLLSPKTVELMTMDHLGGLSMGWAGNRGVGFGLGFGVLLNPGDSGEIGSAGEYSWGGAAGTRFWIDPVEQMVGIFMVQSLPHQTRLAQEFRLLTYQSIVRD